jgi:hypothetical protein
MSNEDIGKYLAVGLLIWVLGTIAAYGVISLVVWLLSLMFPFAFSWLLSAQVLVVLMVTRGIVAYLLPSKDK